MGNRSRRSFALGPAAPVSSVITVWAIQAPSGEKLIGVRGLWPCTETAISSGSGSLICVPADCARTTDVALARAIITISTEPTTRAPLAPKPSVR